MARERLGEQIRHAEFSAGELIGTEFIDANGHLNNSAYFPIFERHRAKYMEDCGMSVDTLRDELGLRPVVGPFAGEFKKQVFPGDYVTFFTSADSPERTYLRFFQRVERGGVEVTYFRCLVAVINAQDRPQPIPESVRGLILARNTPPTAPR